MKHHHISATLAVMTLLLGASLSLAVENQAVGSGEADSKAAPSAKGISASKSEIAARRKAAAKIKPVDINSASPAELKKLPRIGDEESLKIIAGRPYGSSAWLVTKHILPEGVYMEIRDLIVARQPFKDGAKNAEIYRKLSEKEAADKK